MGNINDVKYTDYRWLKKLNIKKKNDLINDNNLESNSIFSPASMTEMLEIEKKYKYYLENKKLENSKEFFNEKLDVFKNEENEYHKFKIPIENEIIYRRKRLSRNNLKLLKPHSMNTLSHLKLFYYESIFEGVEFDENDHFIEKFTHHYTIMHQALINALMKLLKPHLEKVHNIKKEKFTFSKLRNILAKDFELNPYFDTTAFPLYYIRNLTKSNFTEIIIQIFSEKYVFRKVNEVITNKIVNENMMFYILCVYFIYDTEANHSEIERTYKNVQQIDLETYKSENMLVNFEFMSTTAEKKFINLMDNVIEIVYERILNKNWYLSMKSLDTELLSQYPTAKEVIIQKLAERGLELVEEVSNFSLGFYPPIYTNLGENANFYAECELNQVAASYKDIIDIPEILDACPNIQEEAPIHECRGTSLIYVYTVSNEVLQEIAEEYKVHILGTQNDGILKFSLVMCDKNSKGNAFEIARDLWGKNHIGAEPALGGEFL